MGSGIEAHEATISTAAVEIKTLTVKGKGMTLAVFRQIPEADWDGVGQIWGQVTYCPCPKWRRGTHLHIIWQKGNQLRRWAADPPDYLQHGEKCLHEDGSHYLTWEEMQADNLKSKAWWDWLRSCPQLFIGA